MKNLKSILVILFLSLIGFTTDLSATHLTGGEIVWECLPTGAYRFTLVLYRDCSGAPAPGTAQTLTNSSGPNIVCNPLSVEYINPICGAPPCNSVGNGYIGAMQRHVYRSNPVFLTGTPPPGGWVFSWSLCCRPTTVNLVGQANYYLRATMYPYVPPGGGAALNANPCYDSSPNFLESPAVSVCTGQNSEYLALGYDQDLDSLYYDWEPAKISATANATYVTGYSFTSPLPSTSPSVGAVMDHNLGRITFKSAVQGQYAVATKIEEWRCGQKIGEIVRDLVMVTKGCIPPPGLCGGVANNPPSLAFGTVTGYPTPQPVYNANNVLTHYELTVYAKDLIKFRMISQDSDLQPNCTPQNISFKGQGGNLSPAPNYNNANNCFFQVPCATMAPGAGQSGFTTTLNNTVEFTWQTTCDHLTYQPFLCGGLSNTYDYFFRFEDNACPLPAFSYATVKIKVLNYPPIPPDLSNACVTTLPNGDVEFDWIAPLDTGINYDSYEIFRSNNGAAFASIAVIPSYSTLTYTDAAPPAGINRYFMRTNGGCSLTSIPSDTIQNIVLALTPIPPPPNSSVASLSWNPKNPSGPKGETYEIWREICGSGTWELVNTTDTLYYLDTVNVCGDCLNYEIRINNSCNSNQVSGYFADQSNTDIIAIDSLTVINSVSNIAWDTTTTSSDVVEYVILKRDPNATWVPVANVPIGSAMPFAIPGSTPDNGKELYKVVTVDSCGNQSSDLNAVAHNTIFLQVNSDPCDAFVRLRWSAYKQWTQTDVSRYELFADITDNLGNVTNGVLVFQGTPSDTVYDHTNVISGYNYCYYVRVTDTTNAYTATSNRICVTSAAVKKSQLLYLGRTTVKNDGSIEVFGYLDPTADVIDYAVERADNRIGPWLTLGRIPKPVNGPWELKFSDYSSLPESNMYFYRFKSTDSCGYVDTISNIGRNILLRAKANGNLTNTLLWNAYEQFGGIVGRYEVYRMVDNNGAWQLVTDQLTATDTSFIDDIRPFGASSGSFCYFVKAVEANNPLNFVDEYGQAFNCNSNQICITQDARVFVPTAFNPNSDVEQNRVWKPTNVFARANSYEISVYNRWGDKVFYTTDQNEAWDGTFQGEPSPMGVYTFLLKYRSLEGVPIEERGSFTLIR